MPTPRKLLFAIMTDSETNKNNLRLMSGDKTTMTDTIPRTFPHTGALFTTAGLSAHDLVLLDKPLPTPDSPQEAAALWSRYQDTIGDLLSRMGQESPMLDSMARVALVRTIGGLRTRLALLPRLGQSAFHIVDKFGLRDAVYRLAGEFCLMELSAAAGYRTFCFPALVHGLLKSGKMKDRSVTRMIDTFEFLKTMVLHGYEDPRVLSQLERTNGLHAKYRVAGAQSTAARDLFKYIALNMFYIGPAMRPDLTPAERHAICGLAKLVSHRMGHSIEGSVLELEQFISDYEDSHMFDLAKSADAPLRKSATEIARASKLALDQVPTICPARIHGYVPYRVKLILEI